MLSAIHAPLGRLSPRISAAILGLYIATATVVTYPLIRRLGAAVAGRPGDTGFFLWCMDTFWTNVATGTTPFFTDRILYPVGINLTSSSCPAFLSLLALPFLAHLPLFAGLLALASLVAAACGAMLVVRELTDDVAAATLGGLFYGFSPTVLSLLWGSQLAQTVASAILPFGMFFLLRFWRRGDWRSLVWLAVASWAMFFTQFYTVVAFVILATTTSLVLMVSRATARNLGRLAVALAINVMLLWVLTARVFPPLDFADLPRGGYGFTSRAVVNLADVLVPSERNLLFGSRYRAWATDLFSEIDSYFLGWLILALALGSIARSRGRPEVRAIAIGGAVVLLLATGSTIRVGSTILLDLDWTPFEWFRRLPTMEMLDAPRRLVVGTAFVVAVLAGVGLALLARWSGRRRAVLLAGLVAAVVEYGQVGMPLAAIGPPAVYQILATRPGTRSLLEIGGGVAYSSDHLGLDWGIPGGHMMYWQTVHRKPRVGGYVARVPRSTFLQFRNTPVLTDIWRMADAGKGPLPDTTYLPDEVTTFLRTFNLGWVIIPPHKRQAEYAEVMEGILAGHLASMECTEDGALLYTLTELDPR